jgi:hypothetical protein
MRLKRVNAFLAHPGYLLAATGFDPGEVDAIMGDFGEGRANPADEPSLQESEALGRGQNACRQNTKNHDLTGCC